MVLVEDWHSKPSFHTDRPFQTRKLVLLGREGSNPCIGMWHGTCKQSCFVEGVGFHLKLMEAFRINVVGKILLTGRA